MMMTAHVAALQTFRDELFSALKSAWQDEKKHRGRQGADLAFGVFLDDCSPEGIDLGKAISRLKSNKAALEKRTINMDTMQTIDMHVFKDSNTGRSRIPIEDRERLWVQQEFFFSLKRASAERARSIKDDLGHFDELLGGESLCELRRDPRAFLHWSSRMVEAGVNANRQTEVVRNGRSILRGLLARQGDFPINSDIRFQGVFASICYGTSCAAAEIADEGNFKELSLLLNEIGLFPEDSSSNQSVRGAQWLLHDLGERAFGGSGRFHEQSNPYADCAAMMHDKPMDLFWFPEETRAAIHCYWIASLDDKADASLNRRRWKKIRNAIHNLRYMPVGKQVERCADLNDLARTNEIICSLVMYAAVCQLKLRNLALAEENLVTALRMLMELGARRYSVWSDFYTVLGKFMGASGHRAAQGECLLHVSELQTAIGNENAEQVASSTRKAVLNDLFCGGNFGAKAPATRVSSDLVNFVLETPPPLVPRDIAPARAKT